MLQHPRTRLAAAVTAVFVVAACATVQRPKPSLTEAVPQDAKALSVAADAFYQANDVPSLRAALEQAKAAGPASGVYHELAATLARLEDRAADEVEHRLSAAADLSYDATVLQLTALEGAMMTDDQRARFAGLLDALSEAHPRPDVRAQAAFMLAARAQIEGDAAGLKAAQARLGPVLPFAVVGGWDNDQGKGFDVEQPPERGVDLAATYEGSLMPITWEKKPPRDFRGEVELGEFIAPSQWSVAYAATAVKVAAAGDYELRVSSTDPIKVWVNGAQVFEARELDRGWMVDQFIIPVSLAAGENQILVKSAHRTGGWVLFARLTGNGGAPADYAVATAGAVKTAGKAKRVMAEALLGERVAHLPEDSARRQVLLASYANAAHGGHVSVKHTQAFRNAAPQSVVARFALLQALWQDNERGRTADLLGALNRETGDELTYVRVLQAKFWQEEGLRARARNALVPLVEKHPQRPSAAIQLANLFGAERWREDQCRTLEALNGRMPNVADVQIEVAKCWMDEQRHERALPQLRQMAKAQPNHSWILYRMHHAQRELGDFEGAAKTAQALISAYPEQLWPRIRLADTLRIDGKTAEADAVLAAAQQLFPYSSAVRKERASLAWRAGNKDAAVEHWQAALLRDPDDEATANRLDFIAPAATGPWASDVPSEESIENLVASRGELKPLPGADIGYLLDHEVTQLRSDGSTINVVTQVITALNQAGRDKLTRQRLQYGGRHRVMMAYSVDAHGRRAEASVRAREVLYRGLDIGSTIVLQYRTDTPPSGFLPRYLSRMWYFQSLSDQRKLAQLVLWYPAGNKLNEASTGTLEREEKRVGEEIRVSWSMRDAKPVLAEPGMPPAHEVAANVQISTIPGWRAYEQWEAALLEGAIRDSAEVDELAKRLANGATTVEEKLFRIHEFVMQEIRYQQDYESFIAGVKPHPASMVLERLYGDCKDKTVLFMTLARKLGIHAEFATVRTRDRGQVQKSVPTQQFNHAIVYVPKQPGLEEARFFDATADALDLDVLRDDNAGTESLVYDPFARKHAWVQIPWQTPEHHRYRMELAYSLAADGSAKGELLLAGRGKPGSVLRRVSRNQESFKQFIQMVTGAHFPGASTDAAEAVAVTDLRSPAKLRATFTAPNAARSEGDMLRVRLPTESTLKQGFSLAQRRHDLVLGTPNTQEWRFEVRVPEGMRVARAPSSGEITTDCITLSRAVTPSDAGIQVDQKLTIKCERISAQQYPAYRTQVEQMNRFLDEELVITPAKKTIAKPVKATRVR